MSLLFIDGFDHYATSDVLKKWNAVVSNNPTILPTSGRRGGGCLYVNYTSYGLQKTLPSDKSTVIVGCAVQPIGGALVDHGGIIKLNGLTNSHIGLYTTLSGALAVYRGNFDALLGTSANGIIPASGFTYIELKATISDTVGYVEVRVNTVPVLTLSNVDTMNEAYAFVNNIFILGMTSSGCYYDDLYICDSSGTTNNNFLGDVRIDTLFPNADGTYSEFTPSTGTSHYALVDDATPNTTDYNSTINIGARDSYAFANLEHLDTQTIFGLQVNAALSKDGESTRGVASFARTGTSNADKSGIALGTSQSYVSQVFETNPGNTPWDESTINSAEFGVLVTD